MNNLDISKIKCVGFDADNTLYSTKKVAKDADMAAMQALSELNGKTVDELYQKFMEIVGEIKNSPDPKIRHRKYSYAKLTEGMGPGVVEKMYEAFQKVVEERIEIVPGVPDLLETLKDKKLFVITEDNREMALKKLTKLGILDKFLAVVTSDDTGTMKPSKHFYAELITQCKPAEAVVLGDNYEKDLAIPEKLGMHTFLIDEPGKIAVFESMMKQS